MQRFNVLHSLLKTNINKNNLTAINAEIEAIHNAIADLIDNSMKVHEEILWDYEMLITESILNFVSQKLQPYIGFRIILNAQAKQFDIEIDDEKIQQYATNIKETFAEFERKAIGLKLSSETELQFTSEFLELHLPRILKYSILTEVQALMHAKAELEQETGVEINFDNPSYIELYAISKLTGSKYVEAIPETQEISDSVDLYINLARFMTQYYEVASGGLGKYLLKELQTVMEPQIESAKKI